MGWKWENCPQFLFLAFCGFSTGHLLGVGIALLAKLHPPTLKNWLRPCFFGSGTLRIRSIVMKMIWKEIFGHRSRTFWGETMGSMRVMRRVQGAFGALQNGGSFRSMNNTEFMLTLQHWTTNLKCGSSFADC